MAENNGMTHRQQMLRKIQMEDFACFEVALYLDTHKTDPDALEYYRKHAKLAKEAREAYIAHHGPLNISDSKAESSWEWTDGPWPWEYSAN